MTHATCILLLIFFVLFLIVCIAILVLLRQKKHTTFLIDTDTYLLVYASQSGQTEAYAQATAQQLLATGDSVVLLSVEELKAQDLKQASKVIWMLSTYGEGDAPDTAQAFKHWLCDASIDLSHQHFALLAFGDQRYAQFCAFGQTIYARLIELHAKAACALVTVDQQSEADLIHWETCLADFTQQELQIQRVEKKWSQIQLSERILLNAGSQGTGLYHLSFSYPDDLIWQAGDILEVACQRADQSFAIREYSIASVPAQNQLQLVVRQEPVGDGLGLGSGLLTAQLNLNDQLKVRVRHNPSFHLQQNTAPAIFIANGSGIAGILAHLQQRQYSQQADNWLIYGERQQRYDAVFQTQLEQWLQNGHLQHCDLAYSRDVDCRYKYVQDVLQQKAEQLQHGVAQGAYIYVCGSLNGMATAVDAELNRILGEGTMHMLKAENRYRRDVY